MLVGERIFKLDGHITLAASGLTGPQVSSSAMVSWLNNYFKLSFLARPPSFNGGPRQLDITFDQIGFGAGNVRKSQTADVTASIGIDWEFAVLTQLFTEFKFPSQAIHPLWLSVTEAPKGITIWTLRVTVNGVDYFYSGLNPAAPAAFQNYTTSRNVVLNSSGFEVLENNLSFRGQAVPPKPCGIIKGDPHLGIDPTGRFTIWYRPFLASADNSGQLFLSPSSWTSPDGHTGSTHFSAVLDATIPETYRAYGRICSVVQDWPEASKLHLIGNPSEVVGDDVFYYDVDDPTDITAGPMPDDPSAIEFTGETMRWGFLFTADGSGAISGTSFVNYLGNYPGNFYGQPWAGVGKKTARRGLALKSDVYDFIDELGASKTPQVIQCIRVPWADSGSISQAKTRALLPTNTLAGWTGALLDDRGINLLADRLPNYTIQPRFFGDNKGVLICEDYRYLVLDVEPIGCGGSAVLTINKQSGNVSSKVFPLRLPKDSGRGLVVIDLCNPSSTASLDLQYSRYPVGFPSNSADNSKIGGVPLNEGPLWGINRIFTMDFAMPAQSSLCIRSFMLTANHQSVTLGTPAVGNTTFSSPLGRAAIMGNTDGRFSAEVPDSWPDAGRPFNVVTDAIANSIMGDVFKSWKVDYKTSGAWYERNDMAYFGGAGSAIYGYGQDAPDFFVNRPLDGTGKLDVKSQVSVISISAPPGIKDLATFDAGDSMQLPCLVMRRGTLWGLALNSKTGTEISERPFDDPTHVSAHGATDDEGSFFLDKGPMAFNRKKQFVDAGPTPLVEKGTTVSLITQDAWLRRIAFRTIGGQLVALEEGNRAYALAYENQNGLWVQLTDKTYGQLISNTLVDPNAANATSGSVCFLEDSRLAVLYIMEGDLYRKLTERDGRDWLPWPPSGEPLWSDVLRARERWIARTQETIIARQNADQTLTFTCYSLSGFVTLNGVLVDHITKQPIILDDADFDMTIARGGDAIDVAFYVAGSLQVHRSYDDGRSFKLWHTVA